MCVCRLVAMHRETKLKELQLLDAARRKFLHFQKQQREAELRRLDDEMQRKVRNQVFNLMYVCMQVCMHVCECVCVCVCVCDRERERIIY